MSNILIVEDEKNIREGLKGAVELEGYQGLEAKNGQEALDILRKETVEAILSDLRMPQMGGHELLIQVAKLYPHIPFIMITGHGDISDAVSAMQEGAFDFLTKPIDLSHLFSILKKASNQYKQSYTPSKNFSPSSAPTAQVNKKPQIDYKDYFSHSSPMKQLWQKIQLIAPTHSPIAIKSEEGSEIDFVAQVIYSLSNRKDKPFFKIDCASLSSQEMEKELFGEENHEKLLRKGRVELADQGTILWENLQMLSFPSQTKLLEILKNQTFQRVGGMLNHKINLRFLYHNSQKLLEAIKNNIFRIDLYVQLNILEINIPPLRERKEDIPFLSNYFLKEIALKNSMPVKRLSQRAQKKLQIYPYPRNVEELRNLLERLFVLSKKSLIEEKVLPPEIRFYSEKQREGQLIQIPLGLNWHEIEKLIFQEYLNNYENKSLVSRKLGISRKTLYRKIEEYNLKED